MRVPSNAFSAPIAGGIAIALVLAAGWAWVPEPCLNRSVADTPGRGDDTLAATDGTCFTDGTPDGTPSAVAFGVTHRLEVCPTTLGDVANSQDAPSEEGEELRVSCVTVDPERDAGEVLGDCVSRVPGVVGVTGPREEIDKAIRAFHVCAKKVPLEDGGYTMDHSAFGLLFDDQGRLDEPVGYREDPERVMAKIRDLFG